MSLNDSMGTRMKEYYEAVPKTKLMRRTPVAIRIDGKSFHTFTRGFQKPFDMASAFLPGSKPIADEAYDKNCLACVDFYNNLATAMIESLELTGEDAIDAGLQYASCARVHEAVVACMKNLRSEIDGWLEACEDDKS